MITPRYAAFCALLAGCCALATGAPVPPPPKTAPELTPELLLGTWSFQWAGMAGGEITFFSDGSYCSHHGAPAGYYGRWSLRDGVVTLWELPEWATAGPPAVYQFTLAADRWPRLEGKTTGGGEVVLSNRKR
jgi:hypothetical protein